jgi:hypothetical protein
MTVVLLEKIKVVRLVALKVQNWVEMLDELLVDLLADKKVALLD